jgi:hypothetical protein
MWSHEATQAACSGVPDGKNEVQPSAHRVISDFPSLLVLCDSPSLLLHKAPRKKSWKAWVEFAQHSL